MAIEVSESRMKRTPENGVDEVEDSAVETSPKKQKTEKRMKIINDYDPSQGTLRLHRIGL